MASVAYGMRPEDLVFWLDTLGADAEPSTGVLCRRHADSMVVPRNWTLDDLRDPDLHLFRPPQVEAPAAPRRRRASASATTETEQLSLGAFDEPPSGAPLSDDPVPPGVGGAEPDAAATPDAHPEPWAPSFDAGDDLDGLLSARSPLLARAFRGDDRRR